jgi:hypothetical protein
MHQSVGQAEDDRVAERGVVHVTQDGVVASLSREKVPPTYGSRVRLTLMPISRPWLQSPSQASDCPAGMWYTRP